MLRKASLLRRSLCFLVHQNINGPIVMAPSAGRTTVKTINVVEDLEGVAAGAAVSVAAEADGDVLRLVTEVAVS